MSQLRAGLTTTLMFVLLCFVSVTAVRADPLTFGNVRAVQTVPTNPTVNITNDLFANPGVTLISGTSVSFFIDVTGTLQPGSTDTLRLTLRLPDGSTAINNTSIPVFGTSFPPFTVLPGFSIPTYYQPAQLSLTVDLLNSNPDFIIPSGPNVGQGVDSYTYTFSAVQPVPEPATMILLSTGLLGIAAQVRRRRTAAKKHD